MSSTCFEESPKSPIFSSPQSIRNSLPSKQTIALRLHPGVSELQTHNRNCTICEFAARRVAIFLTSEDCLVLALRGGPRISEDKIPTSNTELSEFLTLTEFWCQSELTKLFAELTEFAVELSEFSISKQYSQNSIPPVSLKTPDVDFPNILVCYMLHHGRR